MANAITRAKDQAEAEIMEIINTSAYPQEVLAAIKEEEDNLRTTTRFRAVHSNISKVDYKRGKNRNRTAERFSAYRGVSGSEAQAKLEVYEATAKELEDALIAKGEPLDVTKTYQVKGYPKGLVPDTKEIEELKKGTKTIGLGILIAVHNMRSAKSRGQDESKEATVLPPSKYKSWLKNPNRYDVRGVDTPSGKTKKRKKVRKPGGKATPRMSSMR